SRPAPADSAANTTALLARDDDPGFARADRPRDFTFPRDHGAHGDYRTEWWYFTGHLAAADGREFGFQLTLFRFELASTAPASPSAWRTPRVLLGHFALSDLEAGRFHAFERLARAHPALAGSTVARAHVWLDDWVIEHLPTAAGAGRWRLAAAQAGIELALTLDDEAGIVLQGDAGLSAKSATPGNASYYYSMPRLRASGQLRVDGKPFAVSGTAWLDREWSTSALDRTQQGWDWFSLQLADGANLMFYRLRDATGAMGPQSAGTLQHADGRVQRLGPGDVTITETGAWTSPASGIRYPQGWRLEIPAHGLSLALTARLADQEWRGRFRYWEGAVAVQGSHEGRGYVELTGY
ncbi:MAG: lipocalin-like domain-containing protein, partial [Gammaproteobacteria bacterium]